MGVQFLLLHGWKMLKTSFVGWTSLGTYLPQPCDIESGNLHCHMDLLCCLHIYLLQAQEKLHTWKPHMYARQGTKMETQWYDSFYCARLPSTSTVQRIDKGGNSSPRCSGRFRAKNSPDTSTAYWTFWRICETRQISGKWTDDQLHFAVSTAPQTCHVGITVSTGDFEASSSLLPFGLCIAARVWTGLHTQKNWCCNHFSSLSQQAWIGRAIPAQKQMWIVPLYRV